MQTFFCRSWFFLKTVGPKFVLASSLDLVLPIGIDGLEGAGKPKWMQPTFPRKKIALLLLQI